MFHPVIANDPQNTFTYRVVPGDVNASFLHERLTVFVPNTCGMMPLGLPEDSDWPANRQAYINAIDHWIATGAQNMFGELPTSGNLEPQVIGLLAFPGGNTAPQPIHGERMPGCNPSKCPPRPWTCGSPLRMMRQRRRTWP